MPEEKRLKLKKASIFTKIMIWVLIAYAGVSFVSIALRSADAVILRDSLKRQVGETELENGKLRCTADNIDDPDVVRIIAETKLGFDFGE